MKDIVLYCKSYKNDLPLVKNLLTSIEKYNMDMIPVIISCPLLDIDLFKNELDGFKYRLINDELYTNVKTGNNWVDQQIVKASFWKLEEAENFLVLDSDSEFIRPFYKDDFLFKKTIPFTVCHEQKELFSWTSFNKKELGFDPKKSYQEDRVRIKNVFENDNQRVFFDFGPTPVIWNYKVWKTLDQILQSNKLHIEEAIQIVPSEFTWYGECLLFSEIIPLIPREPLFKVFHYKKQWEEYQNKNDIDYNLLSENYLGIIKQSNWR